MKSRLDIADIQRARELVDRASRIVITSHHNPDGDAIGSSLGWYHFLQGLGKDCRVIVPNDYPGFLKWMPGTDSLIIHELNPNQAEELIANAELIFCLDFNQSNRLNSLEPFVLQASCPKVLIDHHLEPESFTEVLISDQRAAATGEIIYHLMRIGWSDQPISRDIAECLYAAIITDTGSFQYPSTTPDVHRIIAELMETGMNASEVCNELYNRFSFRRMRFVGFCMSERLELLKDLNTGVIALTREDMRRFNIEKGDTEGIVNIPLKMDNVVLAILVTERNGLTKISFRSKGDLNVNEIARRHFRGGGHKNAAGGSSDLSVPDTVREIRKVLEQYKEKILNS